MSREEGDARKRGQVAALGGLGACWVKLLRQSCVQAVRGAWRVLRAGLDTWIEERDLGLRLQRCRNTQSLLKLFIRGYGLDVRP